MFQFKKAIVVVDEEFKKIIDSFHSEEKMKAFDKYGSDFIRDYKTHKPDLQRGWVEYYLDKESQDRKNRYTGNNKIYEIKVKKLRGMFKGDYAVSERVYCPYTNKLIKTVRVYVPLLDFKTKTEVFRYKYGKDTIEVKHKVYDLTKVDYGNLKLNTLDQNFSEEVLVVFQEEWSFEKEEESKVGYLVNSNVKDFVIVRDTLDSVRVYYPHTMSYEDKKVYFNAKNGRYYKYKKNIYLQDPDISDFERKVQAKCNK